jgi:hypothetical protein
VAANAKIVRLRKNSVFYFGSFLIGKRIHRFFIHIGGIECLGEGDASLLQRVSPPGSFR